MLTDAIDSLYAMCSSRDTHSVSKMTACGAAVSVTPVDKSVVVPTSNWGTIRADAGDRVMIS